MNASSAIPPLQIARAELPAYGPESRWTQKNKQGRASPGALEDQGGSEMGLMDEVNSIIAGVPEQSSNETVASAENESVRLERLREALAGEIAERKRRRGEIAAERDDVSRRRTEALVDRDIHHRDVSVVLNGLNRQEDEADARIAAIDREIRALEAHRIELRRYEWAAQLDEIEPALAERLPQGEALAAASVEALWTLLAANREFAVWLRAIDGLTSRREAATRALGQNPVGVPHVQHAIPDTQGLRDGLPLTLLSGRASPAAYDRALAALDVATR